MPNWISLNSNGTSAVTASSNFDILCQENDGVERSDVITLSNEKISDHIIRIKQKQGNTIYTTVLKVFIRNLSSYIVDIHEIGAEICYTDKNGKVIHRSFTGTTNIDLQSGYTENKINSYTLAIASDSFEAEFPPYRLNYVRLFKTAYETDTKTKHRIGFRAYSGQSLTDTSWLSLSEDSEILVGNTKYQYADNLDLDSSYNIVNINSNSEEFNKTGITDGGYGIIFCDRKNSTDKNAYENHFIEDIGDVSKNKMQPVVNIVCTMDIIDSALQSHDDSTKKTVYYDVSGTSLIVSAQTSIVQDAYNSNNAKNFYTTKIQLSAKISTEDSNNNTIDEQEYLPVGLKGYWNAYNCGVGDCVELSDFTNGAIKQYFVSKNPSLEYYAVAGSDNTYIYKITYEMVISNKAFPNFTTLALNAEHGIKDSNGTVLCKKSTGIKISAGETSTTISGEYDYKSGGEAISLSELKGFTFFLTYKGSNGNDGEETIVYVPSKIVNGINGDGDEYTISSPTYKNMNANVDSIAKDIDDMVVNNKPITTMFNFPGWTEADKTAIGMALIAQIDINPEEMDITT